MRTKNKHIDTLLDTGELTQSEYDILFEENENKEGFLETLNKEPLANST